MRFTVDFDINSVYFSTQYLTNLMSVEKPPHNSVIVFCAATREYGVLLLLSYMSSQFVRLERKLVWFVVFPFPVFTRNAMQNVSETYRPLCDLK